jgi:hypothetical protein
VFFKVEYCISAGLRCGVQTKGRSADTKRFQRAAHQRQNDRVNADRARAQHQHGVAHRNFSALDRVQRRGQSAAAGHEGFGIGVEPDAARARLQINLFSPSAMRFYQPNRRRQEVPRSHGDEFFS